MERLLGKLWTLAMVTIEDISQARSRLKGKHVVTPLLEYDQINDRVGGRILFKAENLQRTGSFKFRGALNKIASLSDGQRKNGVVTFATGTRWSEKSPAMPGQV